MNSARPSQLDVRKWPATLFRWLASLQLAVILLVVLAIVLTVATLIEASEGREFTQWFVYRSSWFVVLLLLLAVNVLAAALARIPWRRKHLGFLVTHAGLLVMLCGSLQTFRAGVEGRLIMAEGESVNAFMRSDRSELELLGHGVDGQVVTRWSFAPGPIDWPEDRPLELGTVEKIRVRVLRFFRHARQESGWVVDEHARGPAVLRLARWGPGGGTREVVECVANPFAVQAVGDRPILRFQQAPVSTVVRDFLEPVTEADQTKGVLAVHFQGQRYLVDVNEHLGQPVELGDGGLKVTITAYYPDAVTGPGGRFATAGDQPKNPLLELRIQLPGESQVVEEIVYARNPFVNYRLMRGTSHPIWFWYHHPGAAVPAGVEFLRTPEGRIYCRVGADGRYRAVGEVQPGDWIDVTATDRYQVSECLAHAREDIRYASVEVDGDDENALEAAALIELVTGGGRQRVWVQREAEGRAIETPYGPLQVRFGYERVPLGFSLELLQLQHERNPGGMGDARLASRVRLVDRSAGTNADFELAMNGPIVHRSYAFYQSGVSPRADDGERTILSVSYDPGRPLKYGGGLLICMGICLLMFRRVPYGS